MGLILVLAITCLCCRSGGKEEKPLCSASTQVLRAVACILIVFGHCTAIDRPSFLTNLNVGWYCVAVFMFISGWGVAISYQKKPDYLYNFWHTRLIKILIPFFSMHIIYWVVKTLFGIRYTGKDILLGLLGQCTIVEHSWYPIAILILYFLFWFIFRLSMTDRKKVSFLAVLVIAITYIESLALGEHHDWWYISNFAFALGVMLQIYDDQLRHKKIYFALAVVGYGFAYCLIPAVHKLLNGYNFPVYVLASNLRSMFLCLGIIVITVFFNPRSKFLEKVGAVSYEVYLIHGLFVFVFSQYSHNIVLVFGLTITCSIICSICLKNMHNVFIKKLSTR